MAQSARPDQTCDSSHGYISRKWRSLCVGTEYATIIRPKKTPGEGGGEREARGDSIAGERSVFEG